jgi:hypothetical protein
VGEMFFENIPTNTPLFGDFKLKGESRKVIG